MPKLEIILNTNQQASAKPLLAKKGGNTPGSTPLFTAGDGWDGNLILSLWFYDGAPGSLTSTNVRKTGPLTLTAKAERTEASANLFNIDSFTEVSADGLYSYEAALNLNTVGLLAAVANGSETEVWIDVVEDGDTTTQFKATVRPQVDSGGDPATPSTPPYPTSASIIATQAAVTTLNGAPANGIASASQAVKGDDLRLGLRGGVAQSAAAISSTTGLYSLSSISFGAGDFEICSTVYGRAWSASPIALFDSRDGGLTVYTQGNDIKVARTNQAALLTIAGVVPSTSPLYSSGWRAVALSYSGGTLTVMVDGASVASSAVSLATLVAANIVPAGGHSTGVCVAAFNALSVFSRALTASERVACAKGEWTAAMSSACVARYEHEHCTASRWVDSSGNARDLTIGTGATPIMPRAGMTRTINAKAAGATVAANSVASIGTITGVAGADTAALAAVRQWDAVSAHHAQARPANSGALIATTPSAGAVTVEAQATTSAATFAANHALKLVHNL